MDCFLTNLRAGWLNLPYGDQGLFMRKHNFAAVGGFPDVPIAEDLYLVRRMARNGRIAMAPAAAVTSGRRWQRLGPMRTTMINTILAVGMSGRCCARALGATVSFAGQEDQSMKKSQRYPQKKKPRE